MLNRKINELIAFAIHHGLITEQDKRWASNMLIGVLGVNEFEPEDVSLEFPKSPDSILSGILDWSSEHGLIEDTETERDLLDTKLMGALTPRPSDVISEFESRMKTSPVDATNYFYALGVSSNYILSLIHI